MTTTVEFLYDFGSPNAYYSHCVIPEIEARHDVKFEYVPILLGGIFKATNNVSPAVSLQNIPNKAAYTQLETARWLARYPVEKFERNPHFPVNTLMLMRGARTRRIRISIGTTSMSCIPPCGLMGKRWTTLRLWFKR